MCNGVIVITATIAIWLTAMATMASRACRLGQITRNEPIVPLIGFCRGASGSTPPATSSGSGRSATSTMIRANPYPIAPNSAGATHSRTPRLVPTRFAHSARGDPRTAPTVPTHTTIAIDRARVPSSARSAAANRFCRLAALPEPTATMAMTSSQKVPDWPATNARPQPATPMR